MGGKKGAFILNTIHVTPKGDEWQVKKGGAERASKLFPTQKEAIGYGREKAKSEQSEFFIHNSQGIIRKRDSYGNDDFPPRG